MYTWGHIRIPPPLDRYRDFFGRYNKPVDTAVLVDETGRAVCYVREYPFGYFLHMEGQTQGYERMDDVATMEEAKALALALYRVGRST
jgi:hypothetical protein